MTLLILLCTQEWNAIVNKPVIDKLTSEESRIVWINQCAMRKQVWQ